MDIEYVKQNAESTGNCGDGLTWWQLNVDLYIEGQGEVAYRAFEGCESIQNVVIAPGCTGIGAYAFMCRNLKTVQLPDGLRSVGDGSFSGSSLKTINLPEGLLNIGKCAFDMFFSDENELSLIIPTSVIKIGWHAFCCVKEIIYKCSARPETEEHLWSNFGARIVAYQEVICRFEQLPVPEAEMEITVRWPFSCDVDSTFWTEYYRQDWGEKHRYQYVQGQLLSILEKDDLEAKVRIRILQIKDRMSFVEQVPEIVKKQLKAQGEYAEADYLPFVVPNDQPNIIVCKYEPGGDENWLEHVYTDTDGIDHLILREYTDNLPAISSSYTFVGDKILGYHADCPLQWENGLLVYWNERKVFGWQDTTELIIPKGIESLYCKYNLWNCSKLERITIPDSFERWGMPFHFFDNLKEIILTGNSKIKDEDIPQGVSVIRLP